MSRALIALVLLTLDQRSGEWLPLPSLVQALGVSSARVREVCDSLVEQAQISHATRDGEPVYGVQVEGVAP